jgi:RimJ/RimL family protein N-acetyltransferase
MTAVQNEPSQAVMRRIGLSQHGFFEHPRIEPGDPLRQHVVYWMPRPAPWEDGAHDVLAR